MVRCGDIYHGSIAVLVVALSGVAFGQSKIQEVGGPSPDLASPYVPTPPPDGGVPAPDPIGTDPTSTPFPPGASDPTTVPLPPTPGLDPNQSRLRQGDLRPTLTPAQQAALKKSGDTNLLGQSIREVRIVDNTKTDTNTIEYLAAVKRGMTLSPELVEGVRKRLEESSLFKAIEIYWESMIDKAGIPGVRLVISAKDKLSWIIAPTFAYSPPIYGGGLAFAESNLFGRNMKLLLYGTYTTADKMLLVYFLDPHIGATPLYWRFDIIARRDRIVEYATHDLHAPKIARATDVDTYGVGLMFGVTVLRKLKLDARIKFYFDRINRPTCYNTNNPQGYGTPDVNAEQGGTCVAPARSGFENAMALQAAYDARSNIAGIVSGPLVRAEWTYGPRWMGNITGDYHLLNLRFMWGLRFFKEHNLLLKTWGHVYFNPPFKQEVEAGGQELRGYLYRQFRGDTSFRATIEYIVPVFTIKGFSLRAIAFFDTNLTWFRNLPQSIPGQPRVEERGRSFRSYLPDTPSGVARTSWNNGLGGGIRLYLKGVILPLVGVDLAYGIESNAFQYYITLGSPID